VVKKKNTQPAQGNQVAKTLFSSDTFEKLVFVQLGIRMCYGGRDFQNKMH
jgi:hypothetical protein